MEWFNELSPFWSAVIVYSGVTALALVLGFVLVKVFLGILEAILPKPKMWIFKKDNTSQRVRRFPFEDSKFHQLMLNMSIGDEALIKIKQTDMAALSHLLICRLTYKFPSCKVTLLEDKTLTSKNIGEDKYLITSTSYGEKNWTLAFHEGKKECEYIMRCIDPHTAEAFRELL